jgi:hypothetical protein
MNPLAFVSLGAVKQKNGPMTISNQPMNIPPLSNSKTGGKIINIIAANMPMTQSRTSTIP